MTKPNHSTVPDLVIAWAKSMAESWASASPKRQEQLREKYHGAEEFWEILEAINTIHNGEPTPDLAAVAHEIWRNRLRNYPSSLRRTTR